MIDFAGPGDDASETGLFDWLAGQANADPQREVLIEHVGDDRLVVTVSELFERSRSLAAGLASLGIGEGDVVAIWLPNQVEWVVSEFACAALNVAVLGLNTRYKSHEVSHLLDTIAVSAIILPENFLDIDFIATYREATVSVRNSRDDFTDPRLIFVGEVPPAAVEFTFPPARYADLVASDPMSQWQSRPHVLSNLFTTSGSTSAPKIAGHDQASIVRHSRAGAHALGVREGDRILAALPLCGVFGFNSVMALFFGGGAAVLMRVFDKVVAGELLQSEAVTHVVGGDEMLSAALDSVPAGVDLPALRRGGIANFVGRAKDVVEAADAKWNAKISGVYGSSELFALSAIWPEDSDVGVRALGGGIPVDPGIHVRVVDVESGEIAESGAPGELQFRGYNTISGYVNNESATAAALTADGWFRTGDLGYLQGSAFVYQCRAREALRLHGFLVEPREIEEFFSADPSIEEVHVVGIDTDHGTSAVAFVKVRDGSTFSEIELLKRARQQLANFKVPSRIVEVAEFPTTAGTNGTKVRFEQLREIGRRLLT